MIFFSAAFLFSFLGSIPPGAINISVMQLSLRGRKAAAFRFALAAAIIEYPYAYLAIKFESYLSQAEVIQKNIEILGTVVILSLGIISWWNNRKPVSKVPDFMDSGFRRGLVISILNPLAIPFWIGITAYLRFQGWVEFEKELDYHLYVLGVSLGTFALLSIVALLSARLGEKFAYRKSVRLLPAVAFLLLGLYGLVKLFLG